MPTSDPYLRHGDTNRVKVVITLRSPTTGVVITDTAAVDVALGAAKFWVTGKTNLAAPDAAAELALNSADQAAQFSLQAAISGGTADLLITILPADFSRLKSSVESKLFLDAQMKLGSGDIVTLLLQEVDVLPQSTRTTT